MCDPLRVFPSYLDVCLHHAQTSLAQLHLSQLMLAVHIRHNACCGFPVFSSSLLQTLLATQTCMFTTQMSTGNSRGQPCATTKVECIHIIVGILDNYADINTLMFFQHKPGQCKYIELRKVEQETSLCSSHGSCLRPVIVPCCINSCTFCHIFHSFIHSFIHLYV